jgi:hypothetical protein
MVSPFRREARKDNEFAEKKGHFSPIPTTGGMGAIVPNERPGRRSPQLVASRLGKLPKPPRRRPQTPNGN